MIRKELGDIAGLDGDIAEVGVWKGATAVVMRSAAPGRILHLYDTFKGIVGADPSVDVHGNGDFGDTSVEAVKKALGDCSKVEFHVGTFPVTFTEQETRFCFVYSDTDTYFGTKATLEVFPPLMLPGGRIMFDDYEWKGCPGVKKAIDEFLATHTLVTNIDRSQFTIRF